MKEIKSYLSMHIVSTLTVLAMFIIQGLCVVALIAWGNEIVSTGLVGYGYTAGAPIILSVETYEQQLEKLSLEDKEFVKKYYALLDRADMTVEEYQVYYYDYPVIASQNLMKKTWIGSREINAKLNHVFNMEKDLMIYEYIKLDMDVYTSRGNYIGERFIKMLCVICAFAISSVIGGFVWARLAAHIGYDQRTKLKETKELSRSLNMQQLLINYGNRFYLLVLSCFTLGLLFYYWLYSQTWTLSKLDIMTIFIIMLLGIGGSIYTRISSKGILNKGIFLIIKVGSLAVATAMFGKIIGLGLIGLYVGMIALIAIIRIVIKKAQRTIIDAHSENIDNIEGQLTFVVEKEDIELESVEMKKMVKSYLNNNEYLFQSSWMLEFWEVVDRSLITTFNFVGLSVGIIAMCYLSINYNIEVTKMLPFLILLTF